jgi:3-phenylpropionate/trans-cinnamate dioxygenase ferredoxin reductase subunit
MGRVPEEKPMSEQTQRGLADGGGVLIVGAGLAAAHTITTLRAEGYDGGITLVGDEPEAPYERPPLSKGYLQGKDERSKAFVHEESWYGEHAVTLLLGETVDALNRTTSTVSLASGDELRYSTLVLATGASPRRLRLPGADLEGVHTLRRIEDSEALRHAFRAGGRLAVVGAGWIGLEVAASAREAGMDVAVVAPGAVPLEAALGRDMGAHFAELHRRNGVELWLGTTVTGILERDGHAAGLSTGAGDVPADLVLVAVGAVPNTQLAEAAGLAVDNGIVVDPMLRTQDPAVLAVGDVANAQHASLGRLRVEHWDNAIRQGKLAARTILGQGAVYDWLPYFFTDQYDLGMEYVGRAGRDAEVVVRGDTREGEFIAFWIEDGTVAAAMNVNIWDVNNTLRGIVGRRVPADLLRDAAVPLGEL